MLLKALRPLKISEDIAASGGKVETGQKMDKRHFSRVADKRYTSGFYANVIFESEPGSLEGLRHRFVGNNDVFRVLFTQAPPKKPEVTT